MEHPQARPILIKRSVDQRSVIQTPWELAFILNDVKEQPGIWSDLFNAAVIELIPKCKGVTCLIIRGLTPSSSYALPR